MNAIFLLKSSKLNIIIFIISFAILSTDGFSQKRKGKDQSKESESEKPETKSKNGIKPYDEIITENAISDDGLFTVHNVDGKYYFEIPDSLMEREILIISRITGTIQGFSFGGAGQKARGQQVMRWQKKENQLLLRSVSHNNIASEDKPIYQSVRNNNFEPIIMTFDIKAISKDSAKYVVQVDEFFTTDVPMIGPLNSNRRKNFEVKSLDKKRSLIMGMKSFPLNIEVRHVLTFNATQLPSNVNTNALSIEMNQSMVLLPEEPMMPRHFDRRVGFFSVRLTDYGLDEQKAASRRFVTRWRLEPKDPAAFRRGELVEPVKQIVYYIDPATPMKWRPYIKQGVDDWNAAFAEAGFKNAIIAKDPPSKEVDPDWSPEDVRYSVIRYTANPIQNAQGPHVHDPRSGEIIESDIIWYHNVMNLLRNWFFIQTAAVNPEARNVKFKDEVMGRLIRFVSAHEVGHTLGLQHNMGASYSYPVDSLRSPTFTAAMGTAPSIMDYARFNYVAQPGDNAFLYPQIGVYDKWAIKWAYRPIPDAGSADEELETLNAQVREHENDPMYRFGSRSQTDPRAQTEDLSNDAMKASEYGIANLKRIVPNLVQWTQEDGKNYDDLTELYNNVVSQWNRYNGHVTANIGGVFQTNKTYDQEGVVYDVVPKETQKKAMAHLQKETFSTPVWLINADVLRRIEGTGIVERIRRLQGNRLNQILDPGRLGRLIEAEAMLGNSTYTPLEMMAELRAGIWSELSRGRTIDTYRRNLHRAYIERLEFLMTDQPPPNSGSGFGGSRASIDVSLSDIRPLVRAELNTLRGQIRAAIPRIADRMSRYHLEDAVQRINLILDPK